jgi:predicted transcriptional regulator
LVMNLSNTEAQKLEIIRWVTELEDETAIERLVFLKEQAGKGEWWDEISNEEKASIERGLADVKAGRVTPHKKVKKLYAKWL